jgi:hypothetical protein
MQLVNIALLRGWSWNYLAAAPAFRSEGLACAVKRAQHAERAAVNPSALRHCKRARRQCGLFRLKGPVPCMQHQHRVVTMSDIRTMGPCHKINAKRCVLLGIYRETRKLNFQEHRAFLLLLRQTFRQQTEANQTRMRDRKKSCGKGRDTFLSNFSSSLAAFLGSVAWRAFTCNNGR